MNPLTFNVLEESLDVQRYAFVEASAGTGKTFAIEHLVTRLVLAGIPITRVLVMTFTKAAKTELIRRIHQRLSSSLIACESDCANDIPYLAACMNRKNEAVRLLRLALQTFHEARIATIHGFCQSLLSKYAFEAELSLAFFESQTKEQQLENIRNYLQGYLRKDYLSPVQLEIALKECRGKIVKLVERIGERGALLEPPLDFQSLCNRINEVVRSLGPVDKQKIVRDFQELKLRYNKLNPYEEQPERLADWLINGKVSSEEVEAFLTYDNYYWDLINEENLKKNLKKKDPLFLNYPFLLPLLQQELTPLFQTASTPSKIFDALTWGYQQYAAQFSERMETPDDLLTTMHKAMEKPRFFEKVRGEYDAAIIDEFQDTDAVQWDVFEKLFMRERPLQALYLVGDPKQSIYAFRKADLYSYLQARDYFQTEERVNLAVNYRSEKSLVDSLNTVFSEDLAPGWMALPKIQSSLAVVPVAAAEKAEWDSLGPLEGEQRRGSLHFLLIETQSSNKGALPNEEIHKKLLAPFLAAEIVRLRDLELFPLSRIALLVKDRHQANCLMEELDIFGIPTVFIRSESITASPVFPTILAFLRSLLAPNDLYALKQFLMSPLVNWGPEEMALAIQGKRLPEFISAMHGLKECYQQLGLAGCLQRCLSLRLNSTVTFFEKLFSKADAALYEDFLQIQELLLEEQSQGERSLVHLVNFLEEMSLKNPDENKELQRRVSETTHAVTLMTMHASKGLEFDVVFAVGLPLRSINRDEQDPEEKDAEKMRLLYVAMTRAKRRLYVPVIIDKKQSPFKQGQASPVELFCARWIRPISSYVDWLQAGTAFTAECLIENLQHLQKTASLSWEVLTERILPQEKTVPRQEFSLPSPRTFSLFWQKEELTSFSSLFRKEKMMHSMLHSSATKTGFEVTEGSLPLGAETGNLIHVLIETIFRQGLHCPLAADKIGNLIHESTRGTIFESYQTQLLQMLIPAFTLPIIPIQPGYCSFSLSDIPTESLMAEMEFCFSYKAELRKGFIDLFFMHEGLYYLVDWKTNWLPEYTAEHCDEAMRQHGYRMQAAFYADALQRYVKLFDMRPFDVCFGGAHYLFLRGAKWESFMPDLSLVHQ